MSAPTEIVVSSGGMYNTAFPKWENATSTGRVDCMPAKSWECASFPNLAKSRGRLSKACCHVMFMELCDLTGYSREARLMPAVTFH